MQLIRDLQEWRDVRASVALEKTIGLVPTMGNLHAGHQSLLRRCVDENDINVLSIYVNPTQFDQTDDFNAYQVTLEQDIAVAASCGVDYVLLPSFAQMYPDNFRFKVCEEKMSKQLEGMRGGHFTGVLTVVMKLLQLVSPQNAYFGEKDYQQYMLISDMVAAFFMPINIVACPTIRDSRGLALSSRNQRLSAAARVKSAAVYRLLKSSAALTEVKAALLQQGIEVDYVEESSGRRYAAVVVDGVRLIDNVLILRS